MVSAKKSFGFSELLRSISLLWTEEQIQEKEEKMAGVVRKVLSSMGVHA